MVNKVKNDKKVINLKSLDTLELKNDNEKNDKSLVSRKKLF